MFFLKKLVFFFVISLIIHLLLEFFAVLFAYEKYSDSNSQKLGHGFFFNASLSGIL